MEYSLLLMVHLHMFLVQYHPMFLQRVFACNN